MYKKGKSYVKANSFRVSLQLKTNLHRFNKSFLPFLITSGTHRDKIFAEATNPQSKKEYLFFASY